ncbi:hypothetical protein KC19_1G258200 [Ceratodon purpureus]|uniref:SMP-LTD domain-containing protein n=1 Tax=Ceratodon purpureus TaxID=3225 RepID=A0A8T0JC76_CERPU|nr:hypothetical protein KC19_1G258200 [Ceratodon purpureus]
MEDMGKWNPVTFVRDSIAWLMNLASQVTESLWLALPGNLRQMWDDFQNALQMHMTPGERFGRDAVFIFLVGTVPAFLAGSSSAAMLFGITPGFIAGLGLIVAFFHCQTSRSRERRMKAALISLISEMRKDDFRFLFPKAKLPQWIDSGDLEKINWINVLFKKLWPYFNEAYSRMLMENWAPYLETYKPAFANSVVFQELTLGSIAPHFEGLRMLDLEPKEISLDVETRWLGNASCILIVSSIMGVSFPVQVKNIHMRLVFRFIFKPLLDELPGFGAITYSIRKQRKFDFVVKIIGGEISSVPGVAEKLQVTAPFVSTTQCGDLCNTG